MINNSILSNIILIEYNNFKELFFDNSNTKKHLLTPYYSEHQLNNISKYLDYFLELERFLSIDQKLFNLILKQNSLKKIIAIVEPWCIDSISILPALFALQSISPNTLQLQIGVKAYNSLLSKDEKFNSIPKLLLFSDNKIINIWGSRSKTCQLYFDQIKLESNKSNLSNLLMEWYIKDKTMSFQREMIDFLS